MVFWADCEIFVRVHGSGVLFACCCCCLFVFFGLRFLVVLGCLCNF